MKFHGQSYCFQNEEGCEELSKRGSHAILLYYNQKIILK